MKDRQKK